MIRPATKKDIKEIYDLIVELENKEFPYEQFKEKFLINLYNPNNYYFLYQQDNKTIAFISLHIKDYLHHQNKTGEIAELVVHKDYTNKHIGKELLEYVEQLAKTLNLEELELCTSTWRKDAQRFYETNNYKPDHINYRKQLQ